MSRLADWLLESLPNSHSSEALLAESAAHLAEIVSADCCEVLLLADNGELVMAACSAAPEQAGRVRFDKTLGSVGHVLGVGQTMVVPEEQSSPEHTLNFPGYEDKHYASAIFVPHFVDRQPLGVIVIRRKMPWSPKIEEVREIERECHALFNGYRAYRSLTRTSEASSRVGAVTAVTHTISQSPYLEEILQLLVNLTAQQFGYRVCTVRLHDERADELVLRSTQAAMPEYQRKRAIKVGESIAGRVFELMQPIVISDVQAEESYIGHDLAQMQGLRSMACVPMAIEDRPIGVLTVYTDEVRDFAEGELLALMTIAKQAAFSIERAKLQVRHTLMQEMHHRVKNNLQQVVSLLRLQLHHKHYSTLEDAINDSIGRILSIASVHDLLSRDDLDRVGLKEIASSLVNHHKQMSQLSEQHINFEVRGDDVRLSMTQATQVALILNELVQNSLEHGLMGVAQGELHVTFESTEHDVTLWVANNGNPLPDKFGLTTHSHLGLQIVGNLARGLGGTFTLADKLGYAVAEVKFPRRGDD